MTSATTSDPSQQIVNPVEALKALEVLWPRLRGTVEPLLIAVSEVDKGAAMGFLAVLNSTHIAEPSRPNVWDVEGYNHCISQGSKAIRQLLKDGPAAGGSQSFNAEHCIQIADELLHQVEINRKDCTSGNRAGITIRRAQDISNSAEQVGNVPAYKFDRLVEHAKAQDAKIARLQSELNLYRLYQSDEPSIWVWQGDGEDHPESLGCPVLIQPADLKVIMDGPSDKGSVLRVAMQQGRLGSVPLTSRYYLAECQKCGWLGSSQECISSPSASGDDDSPCPNCYRDELSEVDTSRALELLQLLVFGANPSPENPS